MSEVNTEQGGQEKGKHKKVRAKKSSTHIDMTPMVDLAFLLLTFFMLTTTFSKPKTMELNMPKNDKEKPNEINNGMTVLLTGDNKVFYYTGAFKPDSTQLTASSFDMDKGIHQVLLDMNKPVIDEITVLAERKEKKEIPDSVFKKMKKEVQGRSKSLTVLIKTDDKAKYRNAVDMIDELNSCMIGKYALVPMEAKEYEMLQKLTAK
jgi:biopolymer transport protein ExbD